MRFTIFKTGQWKHRRHSTHKKHIAPQERKQAKLRSWINTAKKSGYSDSDLLRRLELVGWDKKEIAAALPARRPDLTFVLSILMSVMVFGLLYYGPAMLGAFAGINGEAWENKIEIAISGAKQSDTEHLVFGTFRPVNCADGIYVEAFMNNSAIPINFATKNEIFENNFCKELDIEFENIGYAPNAERGTSNETGFSAQPIILTTYLIYYGKIIVPAETPQTTAEQNETAVKEESVAQIAPAKETREQKPFTKNFFSAGATFGALEVGVPTITDWPMFQYNLTRTGAGNFAGPGANRTHAWNFTAGSSIATSPAVVQDIVYIASDDRQVYALNATNGTLIWNFTAASGAQLLRSSPAVSNSLVYIGSDNNNFYALNATNGSEVWKFATGATIRTSPATSDNIVYFGSMDQIFYGLNASNGTQIWSFNVGNSLQSSPVVAFGKVYFGAFDNVFYARNATTGANVWNYTTGGQIWSGPAMTTDRIYFNSNDKQFYALNATNGTLLWNYTMGKTTATTPSVVNDIVYIGNDSSTIFAFNATNGTLLWQVDTIPGGEGVTEGISVANNTLLYFGTRDNVMFVLNSTNGTQIWNYTATSDISAPVVVSNAKLGRVVIFASGDTLVYAFNETEPAAPAGPDATAPSVTADAPVNITTFGVGEPVNISATVTDAGTISAVIASITYPGGSVNNITLSLLSGSSYNKTFTNTTINGTYTARFIANDTAGNTNASVTTSFIISGATFAAVSGYTFVLESNRSTDVSIFPQFGVKNVLINETATNFYVARLITNFSINGTISLSSLIANSTFTLRKSALFRQGGLPNNVTSKDLFVPTTANDLGVFVCPIARSTNDVNTSCAQGYASALDTLLTLDSREYLVLPGINGTGAQTQSYWPMFHHDLRHAGFNNVSGPSTNRTIWNFTAGNAIISSPAVINNTVYFGSDDGNVYAIYLTNGTRIWNFTVFNSVVIRSSPAVINGRVYIGAQTQVYALNATNGTSLWNFTTGIPNGAVFSSPAIANDIAYIGSEGPNQLYALNSTNGIAIWNVTFGAAVTASPAIANNRVYINAKDNNTYAFNATNGTQIWNFTATGEIESSPTIVNDINYFQSDGGQLYALNATNGTLIWNFTTGNTLSMSTPAIFGDRVYVGSNANQFYAVNATNGTLIWNFTVIAAIDSSPAIGNNTIVYFGATDNNVYALNATTGTLIWKYNVDNIFRTSPALVDGILIIGSSNNITYAFQDSIPDIIAPSVTEAAPVNITTFGVGEPVNISATVTNSGAIDAVIASITYPGGSVNNITLSLLSGSSYNKTFTNTTINGTYTARFIANDTTGNVNSTVTTSFIISGSTYLVDIAGLNFTLESNRSADVTRVPQFGMKNVLVENGSFVIARLTTNFAINGTINLTGLSAAASGSGASVIFRLAGFPNNITQRELFVPTSDNNNALTVCQLARSLADANTSCTGAYSAFSDIITFSGQDYLSATNANSNINSTGALTIFDWPMFKQNLRHTGFINISGPVTSNLLWNFTANGTIDYSSPVVSDGLVYFGSDDGQFYALNASNGTKIWNSTGPGQIFANGFGFNPAMVANGIVYVSSGNAASQFLALNASNGTLIWNITIGSGISRSAPALANGIVYFGASDNNLYALNASNGTQIWNFTTLNVVRSSPAVANGIIYVGSNDFQIRALNASNGTLIWNMTTGDAVLSSPAIANNIVYVGSSDKNIYALNASNGTVIWNITMGSSARSSPSIAFGRVYIGTNGDNKLYVFNASNGTQIWNYSVGAIIDSSPTISNNSIVYFGSDDSRLYALNATNGTQIWNYTTGNYVRTTPALALVGTRTVLFVSSGDNKTYAFASTNNVPDAPTLLVPTNDSLQTNKTPILNWTVPSDANADTLHFQVQIANDSAFAQVVESADSSVSATGFGQAMPVTPGAGTAIYYTQGQLDFRKFFWRVRAYDGKDFGAYSNAFQFNVTTSVACDISVLNISFGSNVNPFVALNYNATANYVGFGNGTLYNITSSSNVPVNITHRATNMSCTAGECTTSSDYISAENISWTSNATIANGSNLLYANRIAMQGAFDNANNIASNMSSTSTAWLRFWLAIRGDQGGGNYTGTYTARCVQA